jgi:hypothetical protein
MGPRPEIVDLALKEKGLIPLTKPSSTGSPPGLPSSPNLLGALLSIIQLIADFSDKLKAFGSRFTSALGLGRPCHQVSGTAHYCTRSAHGDFQLIDCFRLSFQSIMGVTAKNFLFAAACFAAVFMGCV